MQEFFEIINRKNTVFLIQFNFVQALIIISFSIPLQNYNLLSMINFNYSKILLLLCLFALSHSLLTAQVTYVKPGGIGDGSSWVNASGNLQETMSVALPGAQIWVAFGTYTPTSCSNCDFTARDTYFHLREGVQVYGGFAGTETNLSQRNPVSLVTTLSGDIDGDGTLNNNSYSIVYSRDLDPSARLDGFTISGGNADNPDNDTATKYHSGGGWFNDGALNDYFSNPTIENCIFKNNYAISFGAALTNHGSFNGTANPTIINCQFINNISNSHGGAIYNDGGFGGESNPSLTNCTFTNNVSETGSGGAIFNQSSEGGATHLSVTDCNFTGNYALVKGGAINTFAKTGSSLSTHTNCLFENNSSEAGGAIANDGSFNGVCNPTYTNCQFKSNTAFNNDGGAVFNFGALAGNCSPDFTGCLFEENSSEFAGAAIFNNAIEGVSVPNIINCRFLENTAGTYGGAIYNQGKTGNASPKITNCLFFNNGALSAGAVYNLGSENGNSSPEITNCTFYGNHANVGGAIYNNASDATGNSSPIISNCIIYGNTAPLGPIFRNILGTPTIKYSLIDAVDCESSNSGIDGTTNCGEGMYYNVDPMFSDAANGNLHISSISSEIVDHGDNASINQANVTVDLDNLPRIHNATVDMGVFEFGSMAGNSIIIVLQPNDYNICSGEEAIELIVDANSSLSLSFQWQKNGVDIPGANASTLLIDTPNASDSGDYVCIITNEAGAIIESDVADVTVTQTSALTVNATATNTTICANEQVTFNAETSGTNAENLTYQWFINGNSFGGSIATFNIDNLNNGDIFHVVVSSNASCLLNNTATSESLTIQVTDAIIPSISIIPSEDTTLCIGATAVFNAMTNGGGTAPAYAWTVNGNSAGDNSNQLILSSLNNNDVVTCSLTSSAACAVISNVTSNSLTVAVEDCTVAVQDLLATDAVSIFPNPVDAVLFVKVQEDLTVEKIRLTDLRGVVVSEISTITDTGIFSLNTEKITVGMYLLEVQTAQGRAVRKVVVE